VIILDFYSATGGTGRCTCEILKQLSARKIPVSLTGRERIVASYRQRLPRLPSLQLVSLDRPRWSPAYWRIKRQQRRNPRSSASTDLLLELARKKADSASHDDRSLLVIFPHVAPPPEIKRDFTVFIHDLNWRHFPENFSEPQTTDDWCKKWVERATRVVANSEFTRAELIQHYHCPPEKIIAAPLAPFADAPKTTSQILARLNLEKGKFYLYPAVWGVHKGHDILTDALEKMDAVAPVVVTCGVPDQLTAHQPPSIHRFAKRLAKRWEKLITQKKLVVVANLSETDIHALRTNCKAFVLPSRFEGYGFPLAEAIYHHKPAIVSDIPAFREMLARYPQYQLARIFSAASSQALAEELNQSPTTIPPISQDWQQGIETTWSWAHTTERVLAAVR